MKTKLVRADVSPQDSPPQRCSRYAAACAPAWPPRRRRRRFSTFPTIRRANSTTTTTSSLPSTGRRRPAKTSPCSSPTAGRGKQARAVIDGLQRRRRNAGVGLRHRRHRRKAKLLPANWQTRLPNKQHAVHLDDRLSRASRQSQAHPRLERSRSSGRLGDHAESQDVGRCALELSCRMGVRAERSTAVTTLRPKPSSPSSTRTFRCSIRARAARRRRSSSAASATSRSPGRTMRFLPSKSSAPGKLRDRAARR